MVGYKSMESSDLSARSWVSTLGWYEVWVVAACSAVPCVFMLAVFELQRHRRTESRVLGSLAAAVDADLSAERRDSTVSGQDNISNSHHEF